MTKKNPKSVSLSRTTTPGTVRPKPKMTTEEARDLFRRASLSRDRHTWYRVEWAPETNFESLYVQPKMQIPNEVEDPIEFIIAYTEGEGIPLSVTPIRGKKAKEAREAEGGGVEITDEVYRKHINIVHNRAWRAAQSGVVEYEEAYGEGVMAFVRACQTYRPGRGTKLSTWIYTVVGRAMTDLVRRRVRESQLFLSLESLAVETEDGEVQVEVGAIGPETVEAGLRVQDLKKKLGETGLRVLGVLFEQPELLGLDGGESATEARKRVKWWMERELGLRGKALQQAYEHIVSVAKEISTVQ